MHRRRLPIALSAGLLLVALAPAAQADRIGDGPVTCEPGAGAACAGVLARGFARPFANLQGIDLRGAHISAAILHHANLRNADLRGAMLNGAVLQGADLRGADLRGARLRT